MISPLDILGDYQIAQTDREWLEYRDEFSTYDLEVYICEVYVDQLLQIPDERRLALVLGRVIKNRIKRADELILSSRHQSAENRLRIEKGLRMLDNTFESFNIRLFHQHISHEYIDYYYRFFYNYAAGSWLLYKLTIKGKLFR